MRTSRQWPIHYGSDVETQVAGPYVVGVDAGGTTTRCAVMSPSGTIAGYGRGPGANRNSGGDAITSLTTALRMALRDLNMSLVAGGVFGIAGAGAAGRAAALHAATKAWQSCGLTGTPSVVTDITVAFASGTSEPTGVVVFSGTGAGAAVVSEGKIVRRADGYGWLVGDEGSAVWLGREAVRAALNAHDGRGPDTVLAEAVPDALFGFATPAAPPRPRLPDQPTPPTTSANPADHLGQPRRPPRPVRELTAAVSERSGAVPNGVAAGAGTQRVLSGPNVAIAERSDRGDRGDRGHGVAGSDLAQAIIKEVYGQPPAALGRLGPVVCQAAIEGDPVAVDLTAEAARWLLMDVDAVTPALSVAEFEYAAKRDHPVVMAGSVLDSGPVADAVRAGLRERFSGEPLQGGDGAVGAAGMALHRLGIAAA
jgi:glucosamine kinase